MARVLAPGDLAPNFDLASTEDVVLMLGDEVPRTAVLLYFFPTTPTDRVRKDLVMLAGSHADLREKQTKILGVSSLKVPALQELQRELELPFPLLCDDRGFSAQYGVSADGDGEEAEPALALIDRQQLIAWIEVPTASMAEAMAEVGKVLQGLPSPTSNYPRSILSRVVDFRVN